MEVASEKYVRIREISPETGGRRGLSQIIDLRQPPLGSAMGLALESATHL
jgi:hypothetical protein